MKVRICGIYLFIFFFIISVSISYIILLQLVMRREVVGDLHNQIPPASKPS